MSKVILLISSILITVSCGKYNSHSSGEDLNYNQKIMDESFNLEGNWIGIGKVAPRQMYSINIDFQNPSQHFPDGFETKCVVTFNIAKHTQDLIDIGDILITLPEVIELES